MLILLYFLVIAVLLVARARLFSWLAGAWLIALLATVALFALDAEPATWLAHVGITIVVYNAALAGSILLNARRRPGPDAVGGGSRS